MRKALLLTLLLSGCAGWEIEPPGSMPASNANRQYDSGLQNYSSLHFAVNAVSSGRAIQVANISEDIYKKVMFDANLLSFKPRENYPITVFPSHAEYQRQTGYPAWSGGGALTQPLGQVLPSEREVRALTRIDTFEEVLSPSLLAHEITHLVFNEFMAFYMQDDAERVRWLNEGFATYQEMEALSPQDRDDYVHLTRSLVQQNSMSLDKLVNFNPFRDPTLNLGSYNFRGRSYLYTNIDLWYWQSREVVSYLISAQGRYNFYLLLSALKSRKTLEQSIAEAYPGKWRSLRDLESEWAQFSK